VEADARVIVREVLSAGGVPIDTELVGRCGDIADWLGPRAAQLGLTQYRRGADVALQLMAPVVPLAAVLASGDKRVAEVGAGSGALGLALAAVCPTVHVTLIDRRRRAAGFIDLAIRRFGIVNAAAVCDDFRSHTGAYDWVVARALAPGSAVLARLWRLCGPGGHIGLIESDYVRRAPAGLRRSSVFTTAIEGLRMNVYEADGPAS